MGVTKTENFTAEQNQMASIAKALAHPARIAILQEIFKAKSCICGDLVGQINLAQPTISQHLKELKNAGLIKGNIEGTSVCYCIDDMQWTKIKALLFSFLDQDISIKKECC